MCGAGDNCNIVIKQADNGITSYALTTDGYQAKKHNVGMI
jgi:hypothetical protein